MINAATDYVPTRTDPFGKRSWEQKFRETERNVDVSRLCAVALLDPTLYKKCKEKALLIADWIDFDKESQEILGLHRRMLYESSNERIEAAHPSTRDFSLEGLPEDATVDMVSHFDNWINRNKYNVDKALG